MELMINMTGLITFEPLFMERVWGGRRLESFYGKTLPQGVRIGESWELVDREEAQSVVHDGPLRGRTLGELWKEQRVEIFGSAAPDTPRFPLLIKILDAQETLSVQVHPPASVAPSLDGEPKTEMWYLLSTTSDGLIYAGLKNGVSKQEFSEAITDGTVESCLHRIYANPGDCIFIPSGRVHAIGAGNLILEVQQNSDTTYRVFDWNRVGVDGKSRQLHVNESMKSIDFDDFEPAVQAPDREVIVASEYFRVSRIEITGARPVNRPDRFVILFCESGEVRSGDASLKPGQFALVPASEMPIEIEPVDGTAVVICATLP
jgi:mannose-6-phosphate isomerase